MNKSNLINAIASDANLTYADAGRNSQLRAQITIVVAKIPDFTLVKP